MKLKHTLLFLFLVFVQNSFLAQSLTYSGSNSFDISNPNFIDATAITSHENSPTGMEFGDSGTKFYTVGSRGDFVVQHNLSIAYDLSTISGIDSFISVEGQDSSPHDITFNNTGSKMYITGDTGNDITEYDLSTNWDVSTATVNDIFDFEGAVFAFDGSSATLPQGMSFNNDGSKLFIVDRGLDKVFEFDLTTNYDVSTATIGGVINELLISSFENNPRGITFNNDGSEMYITGANGDEINIFTFTSGNEYDLSAASHLAAFSVAAQETAPQDILFNNVGSKFYILGINGEDVDEYTLSNNFDFTSTINFIDSYKILSFENTPQDVLFNNDGTKMYVVGDNFNSIAQYTLSNPYDSSTASLDDSFSIEAQESNPRGMAFNNTGSLFYIVGTAGDEVNEYSLSIPYDLTSTVTHLAAFDISVDDNNCTSISFNDDGTLLFILGNEASTVSMPIPSPRNDVIVYTLPSAYDLTGIASGPTGRFSVSAQDTAPLGMAFSNDGLSLFIAGNSGNDINEYLLSSPYDVLTVAPTFVQNTSVASEDTTPSGIAFNASGTKMFISGNTGNDINEYSFFSRYNEISASNNGTIDNATPLTITLTGDTFADADADNLLDVDTEFTIANLPLGLTPVLTLSSGDTVATLTFTGKAASHINSDEPLADLIFTFTDNAFTASNAVDVSFAVANSGVTGFNFIECEDNEIVYDGTWSGGNNAGVPDNSATDLLLGIRIQDNVTITADTNCDCLNIETGQTLTVADGVALTVSNALELEGDIRLLGSAQLLQTHTDIKNVSGTGNLYKDIKSTLSNVFQYGYWSSPVTTDGLTYTIAGTLKDGTTPLAATGEPLEISFSTNFDGDDITPIRLSTRWLAKFINNSDWSVTISETSELFNPGEGFAKKSTGAAGGQNYTFKGKPNDGDYTHTIGAFVSSTLGPWSLLGNPYTSPINADTFILDNAVTAGSIVGTLYFYEAGNETSHLSSEYLGGYATRVSGMGTPAPEIGMSGKVPGQNIGIGQGFFVEASGTGGTITFNNNQRVFDIGGTNTEFFSKTELVKKENQFPILRIGFEFNLNEDVYHRQVAVGFRGLTKAYENGYEGETFDLKPTDMSLKMEGNEGAFSILGIEDFNKDIKIPLKVKTDKLRNVTFLIDENQVDSEVFLLDQLTNNYYNLSEENAEINLAEGDYDSRFFIVFKNENTLTVHDESLQKILVFNTENQIIVKSNDVSIEDVNLYNILGKQISIFKSSNSSTEISIPTHSIPTGVFIVKVKTPLGMLNRKIIIN